MLDRYRLSGTCGHERASELEFFDDHLLDDRFFDEQSPNARILAGTGCFYGNSAPGYVHRAQRGNGSGKSASAYPMTAMAAAFSRSSWETILSSVSAAV
jgi:hypothetical protein